MPLDVPATILVQLLRADGITIPDGTTSERMMKCFNPHHDDAKPSMSVNVAKGVYYCHVCNLRGNAYTYLTQQKHYAAKQAVAKLMALGASAAQIANEQDIDKREVQKRKMQAYYTDTIPERLTVKRGGTNVRYPRHQTFDYHDTEKRLRQRVVTYLEPSEYVEAGKKPRKEVRPFTPRSEGGWWWKTCTSELIPVRDRAWSLPLYRAPALQAIHDAVKKGGNMKQVWIVEDEKCVEAIRNAEGFSNDTPPPVTTLANGGAMSARTDFSAHDLTPLYGLKVCLFAAGTDRGRTRMTRLGLHLHPKNCDVRYVLPPDEGGETIGDAADAGGWQGILDWIKEVGGVRAHDEVHVQTRDPVPTVDAEVMANTPHFRVLGENGRNLVFQKRANDKIVEVRANRLAKQTTLSLLAPHAWWTGLTDDGRITAQHRTVWADALMRVAETKRDHRPGTTALRRTGAHRLGDGRIAFNMGDAVLMEDAKGSDRLTHRLTITDANAACDEDPLFMTDRPLAVEPGTGGAAACRALHDALLRCRWTRPAHGQAFCGWLVAALIGGALEFRPHLWLVGGTAGADDRTVLFRVVQHLFDDHVIDLAGHTEAQIAQAVNGRTLPAVLDGFDPRNGRAPVLGPLRSATDGAGTRLRATGTGAPRRTTLQFAALLGSRDRPALRDTALRARLWPISLRPGGGDASAARTALAAALDPKTLRAIRSHIITHAPQIVAAAQRIEDALQARGASGHDPRIRGILSAGVRFLQGGGAFVLPARDRQPEGAEHLLATLLATPVAGGDGTPPRPLGDVLLDSAYDAATGAFLGPHRPCGAHRQAQEALGRTYGLRLEGHHLVVAKVCPARQRLLAGTAYADWEIATALLGLDAVDRATTHRPRIRVNGKRCEAVQVPRSVLERIGFFDRRADAAEAPGP